MQEKEIISLETGERLGNVLDLEIDVDRGRITDIVIGSKNGFSGFFQKQEELSIPWNNIVTFGQDVILVKGIKTSSEQSKE